MDFKDCDFVPVIFGSDINTYSMARAFHEAYRVKSIVVGKYPGGPSYASRIVDFVARESFPGLEVSVVRDITSGDEAALEWEAVLIDREGKRFPIYGVNLVRIRDGKFTHVRAYYDPTKFPQPAPR